MRDSIINKTNTSSPLKHKVTALRSKKILAKRGKLLEGPGKYMKIEANTGRQR